MIDLHGQCLAWESWQLGRFRDLEVAVLGIEKVSSLLNRLFGRLTFGCSPGYLRLTLGVEA